MDGALPKIVVRRDPTPTPASSSRYSLKHKLSEGGMAEVFLARQNGVEGFEKLVVIKRIQPALSSDPEFVKMLVMEARILARLTHPNIVQVYELGRLDSQYFIAMEFVHGENLRAVRDKLSERDEKAPLGFACRIIADVLAALDYAHLQRDASHKPLGLVHRDVSPANVLVTYEGGVKLVDFGIAKSNLLVTQVGRMKGKFAYMSPEQVQLQPLDGRSDVFAVGIMLWELLAGRPLFRRSTVEDTIRAVLHDPVPPLREADPRIPARLEEIVVRALARDRDQRYATADAMRADLEALIREERLVADGLALRAMMRDLFADEIAAQEAATQGTSGVIDYLLSADESTSIGWIGARREHPTPTGDSALLHTETAMVRLGAASTTAPMSVADAAEAISLGRPTQQMEAVIAPPAPLDASGVVQAEVQHIEDRTAPSLRSRVLLGPQARRAFTIGGIAGALVALGLLVAFSARPSGDRGAHRTPPAVVEKPPAVVVPPPPPTPTPTPPPAPPRATVVLRSDVEAAFRVDDGVPQFGAQVRLDVTAGVGHTLEVRPIGKLSARVFALPTFAPSQTATYRVVVPRHGGRRAIQLVQVAP